MIKYMIHAIEYGTSSLRSVLLTMFCSVLVLFCIVCLMCGCSNNAGNEDESLCPQPGSSCGGMTPGATCAYGYIVCCSGTWTHGGVCPNTPIAPTPMPSASTPPAANPQPATRSFTVVFEGSPAGRLVLQRHCEGSPVSAGDVRPDKQAQFKPWPDQDVNSRDTWRSFGGDVTHSYATYSRFVTISKDTSLRFQCYDNKGDPSDGSYGCTTAGVRGVRVYENGAELPVVIVTNLVGSANCQVN